MRSKGVRMAMAVGGAAVALGVLVTPAAAHIAVDGEVAPGGNGTFTFTIPNESDTANTVEVSIQMPEEHPLGSLRSEVMAGWTVTTTTRTLDEPIEVFGAEVTEVVDTVTFTAEAGAGIPPGQFARFSLRGGPFPEDVESVAFPTVQTYDDGEESAWIEQEVDGQPEPENPVPVLVLSTGSDSTSDHGDEEETTTTTAAPDDSEQAASDTDADDDDGTDPVAVAALILAIVGFVLGTAAFVTGRRRTT